MQVVKASAFFLSESLSVTEEHILSLNVVNSLLKSIFLLGPTREFMMSDYYNTSINGRCAHVVLSR